MISEKPIVTMNTLGGNGRFGNQLFQYAFLRIYANVYNLEVMTPKWIGQYLYGHNDPTPTHQFKTINEYDHPLFKNIFSYEKPPFENVDFWGYFQFPTHAYAPYKDYFRSLFKPVDSVNAIMEKGEAILRSKGKTIVAMHHRRGDYKGYGGVESFNKIFYVAPTTWYKKWLENIWPTLDNPVLFIASDELYDVLDDFKEYNPVTSKDLFDYFSPADFYPDFYILSKSDIMAISNSSFSFAASMLNENCKGFFRADLNHNGVIPYDPWSSQVLVNRHLIEPY
ncbi:alpha-1,2-fucosyltransferase [Paenibacillus sp. BSR1-1]|uniref:alpha-1,2-fucosyltransferase n=1 Tax=Paenibacillus sp. BSR1-1 TaxID=3020845 RepID=UPI0025AFED70|nr:alpha-1,2-fucosyltransferase [Paenibacillus sp. BSR1-1]MDN3017792.1 alpha-1,2-fucosyltransferase [Paenibacillus sp. BSR1-1]